MHREACTAIVTDVIADCGHAKGPPCGVGSRCRASPTALCRSATPGDAMNRRREQAQWDQLQADRRAVDTAAAWLRTLAWEESYAGFNGSGGKDRAFALASFLESVSVQLDRVPEGLRIEAVRTAEWLVGGSA